MYKAWLEWLQNDDIPSEEKCEVLHKQDEQGWCALHYAVRYYCTDILGAALEVEGGKQAVITYSGTCTCVIQIHTCMCNLSYTCACGSFGRHLHSMKYTCTCTCICHRFEPRLRQLIFSPEQKDCLQV